MAVFRELHMTWHSGAKGTYTTMKKDQPGRQLALDLKPAPTLTTAGGPKHRLNNIGDLTCRHCGKTWRPMILDGWICPHCKQRNGNLPR